MASAAPARAQAPGGDGSLAFIAGLAGKTPSEGKLFTNQAMKARLAALVKADAALVEERFQTESPIEKSGDVVAAYGNKAHSGGTDVAVLAVNVKTDELWVWVAVNSVVRRYGPAKDPATLPEDAATYLSNMGVKRQ